MIIDLIYEPVTRSFIYTVLTAIVKYQSFDHRCSFITSQTIIKYVESRLVNTPFAIIITNEYYVTLVLEKDRELLVSFQSLHYAIQLSNVSFLHAFTVMTSF